MSGTVNHKICPSEAVSSQNRRTEQFLSGELLEKNSKFIRDIYEESLVNLCAASDGLYALAVDGEDHRRIKFRADNNQKAEYILGDEDFPGNTYLDRFVVSPEGRWMLAVTKDLFRVLPTAYLYERKTMRRIAVFPQCGEAAFLNEEKLFLIRQADLNDLEQTNGVLEVTLAEEAVQEEKCVLEIEEMNTASLLFSRDRKQVVVQVLLDYYKNDAVYYRDADSREPFRTLTDGGTGRWLFAGADAQNIYLQTDRSGKGVELAALDRNAPDITGARVLTEPGSYVAKGKPAAFLLGDVMVCFTQRAFGIGMDVLTKEGKVILRDPLGPGLYAGNLSHLQPPSGDSFWFTFENEGETQSIWKLDGSGKIFPVSGAKLTAGELVRETIEAGGVSAVVVRRKGAVLPAKTFMQLSADFQSDMLGNHCSFQGKTPCISWLKDGGVCVFVRGFTGEIHSIDASMAGLTAVMDALVEKGYALRSQLGLMDAGYGGGAGLQWVMKHPGGVGAFAAFAVRSDLEHYVHDASGYMFKEIVGDPEGSDREKVLSYSPVHLICGETDYPPMLMENHDYNLLVPAYHAESFIEKMQKLTDGTSLMHIFSEESFLQMMSEILTFFEKTLKGGNAQ